MFLLLKGIESQKQITRTGLKAAIIQRGGQLLFTCSGRVTGSCYRERLNLQTAKNISQETKTLMCRGTKKDCDNNTIFRISRFYGFFVHFSYFVFIYFYFFVHFSYFVFIYYLVGI